MQDVLAWQKINPTTADSYYYESMIHLSKFRYDEFLRSANHFLFLSRETTMPVILTRYYMAMAYVAKKNPHEAFANLIICLSAKPLMAEFWCLLGDIYYFLQRDFNKAFWFYKAAIALGSRRNIGDTWPVQLSKYNDYPLRMIESCKMIGETHTIIRS